MSIPTISDIRRPQLRKDAQYAVIALLVFAVHRGEELLCLRKREISRQGLGHLWRVYIQKRVRVNKLCLYIEIFVEASDCGYLSGAAGGGKAVFGVVAALVFNLVSGQEGKIIVELRKRNRLHKIQVYVLDGYVLKACAARDNISLDFQKSEEVSEIEIIFVHGSP
jgi:hypothetical protein